MPVNEAFGWIWILAGFVSGLALGLFFQRDDWLGGYASFRRRLLRLGHISFIGLGFVNILFALSAAHLSLGSRALAVASAALLIGGITMPLCCALMAWRRGFHVLFAVPVVSLIMGVALVVRGLLGL
jgi:uncharacterized membrane protein